MESTIKAFSKLMERMRPIDLLAMIVVIGSFILIGLGPLRLSEASHDGVVSSVLMAIVGFYFGFKTTPRKE